MFTVAERDQVRSQLLARPEADGAITGAAFTGSLATGDEDRWSDTDLVLAVRGSLSPVVDRWNRWLYQELGAQHHWDLTAGPPLIRVFLLPGWIEIDLAFAPENQFGPRGPQWRTIFGQPQSREPFPPLDPRQRARCPVRNNFRFLGLPLGGSFMIAKSLAPFLDPKVFVIMGNVTSGTPEAGIGALSPKIS